MDVLVLIDKLDDLVHNARPVPLTDQVRVDREEVYDILDQMRATIPEEIKQARWIVKERQEFLADATADLDNVEVEIFSDLLVEFARRNEARAIVKGLRAISDFEYEFEMNQLNRKLAPEIESMYIFASAHYSFLSSTGVKEMATFGGDVSDLVPASVSAALTERARRGVA